MNIRTHIREAFHNLFSAKMRSFLAILGVLVGTGSVVALISSGQLATEHALAQFKTLGTNLLSLYLTSAQANGPKKSQSQREFMIEDVPTIRRASNEIVEIAPYTSNYQSMRYGNLSFNGEVLGATRALQHIVKINLAEGRFVSYLDDNSFYCVIGAKIAAKMRAEGINPMGKQILMGNYYFTIVGIAKPWKPSLFFFNEIDDGAIVPLQTSYLLSNHVEIDNILFRLIENPDINTVQKALTDKMHLLLPDKTVQFRNPEQIIQLVGKQRKTFTWLLGAIGGISLLVGGIGVMNIMLVSVVERRKEIGIRMAIGAMPADIMKMFLIESIILTLFGGLMGILLGVGASYIIARISDWGFSLLILPPILGFAVSFLVGILSGIYPSWRASRLDPIQTLQSD